MVQVHVWIDTGSMRTLTQRVHPKSSGSASMDYTIEEHSLKVREMQEYTQTQISEERRQRVLQAKKRYNCYTEKNIVIVLR